MFVRGGRRPGMCGGGRMLRHGVGRVDACHDDALMTPFGGRGGDERKSTLKEEDGAHTGSVDSAAALSVRRRTRLGKGRKRHGNGAGNTIPRQQGPRRRETARAQEAGKRWQQWGGGGQREKEVGEQGTDQLMGICK